MARWQGFCAFQRNCSITPGECRPAGHSSAAVALQDTLTLCLRHQPLITLARQYPDLSLALINVLGERLRAASDRVAELTRSHPRALHRLFDQLT